MKLGTWVYTHNHDITGAPSDLLEAADTFVMDRLRVALTQPPTARVKAKIRWLCRWKALIMRQRTHTPHEHHAS